MYPSHIENYHAPTALAEVLRLLAAGGNVKLLAGGQTLIPLMKTRLLAPETLIDLNRVAGLDGIVQEHDRLCIGALVRHHQASRDALLQAHCPALAAAAGQVADRQVRNRGTLAGSLVYADYTGDIAPGALASAATLQIARADGTTRRVALDAFLLGPFTCDLRSDEVVTAIECPLATRAVGGAYLKHGRSAHDRVTVSVAVQLALDAAGACAEVRVAVGGIAPRAMRVARAETMLGGQVPVGTLLTRAGEAAAAAVTTQSDELATAAYRSQLIRILVPEALMAAAQRAQAVVR